MLGRLLALAFLVLLAVATPAAAQTPSFEGAACPKTPAPVPALQTARCGYLTVPENRSRPDGPTIRLLVAIVPAQSATPATDPIVHMTGGPGGIAILEAQDFVDAGLTRDRDLILMDQRGTKYSQPALTCPEIDAFLARSVASPLDTPSTRRAHVAATAKCRRRLVAKGVDIAAYNTTENAADFADLRKALGLAQWNVFSVSYGTDLALTYMREHPEGIRTVTLDSVVPPSAVTLSRFWPNARDGFDALFADHRGLERTFTRQVRKLEAKPVVATVKPAQGGGNRTRVALDGGALVNWLVAKALATPSFATVPAEIRQLAAGRPRAIAADRASVTLPGFVGYGLVYGVACSEWVPYEPASRILPVGRQAFPRYPYSVLAQPPQFTYLTGDCRAWNVPAGPPAQRDVTSSTIPTLAFDGTYDSITPIRWGRLAAQTIAPSTIVVIPRVGHFVMPASPCAQQVLASFLATPATPDTSCVPRAR
jgi:pimeloyl-ACP methyl ester carboxylesterase